MTLLTIFILWAIGCLILTLAMCRLFHLCPDLEDREYEDAKARNVEPVIPETPIPKSHYVSYYGCWIAVLGCVCLGILFWERIINFIKSIL